MKEEQGSTLIVKKRIMNSWLRKQLFAYLYFLPLDSTFVDSWNKSSLFFLAEINGIKANSRAYFCGGVTLAR